MMNILSERRLWSPEGSGASAPPAASSPAAPSGGGASPSRGGIAGTSPSPGGREAAPPSGSDTGGAAAPDDYMADFIGMLGEDDLGDAEGIAVPAQVAAIQPQAPPQVQPQMQPPPVQAPPQVAPQPAVQPQMQQPQQVGQTSVPGLDQPAAFAQALAANERVLVDALAQEHFALSREEQ